jgi:outer membrane protein assembly factor BamC
MKLNPTAILLPLLAAGLLSGCSSLKEDNWLPDNSVDYRREKAAEKNLEVPPDLTSRSIKNRAMVPELGGVSVTYSELQQDNRQQGLGKGSNAAVLPTISGVKMMRDGQNRWLVINGSADTVWNRVLDFWQQQGVLLVEQDPMAGVMRTAWLENRADIKNDVVTDALRSLVDGLYDAGTRDQYRVRLERAGPSTTELYLTHFGAEEEIVTDSGGESQQTVWNHRPRDPQLEAEMLRRIMVYLGVAKQRAAAKLAAGEQVRNARSQLITNNQGSSLSIDEGFDRAWRLAGLALDRVGFTVQDRNREAGVYYVSYADPDAGQQEQKSWMSKLAFWRSDEETPPPEVVYQVLVKPGDGQQTLVTIHDDKGQPLNTPVAKRILTLMHEQLR